jgi:hypothetical protein
VDAARLAVLPPNACKFELSFVLLKLANYI